MPKFGGLSGEDPHKHLKEFRVMCSTPLRPEGITEDHIKHCLSSLSHSTGLQRTGYTIFSQTLLQAGLI
ncbi:hypothetical protein A2U01_0089601 [Trifolium medium]|uniref:Uncharacterized protein n=1 Tax=Trifolium medium TaxID=97028 RepID=A0A392U4H0_9FABA|nr:hypothetical protein [Trifolium medium]